MYRVGNRIYVAREKTGIVGFIIAVLAISVFCGERVEQSICGIASLQYASRLLGVDIEPGQLNSSREKDSQVRLISLLDLFRAAQEMGLSPMGVRMTWEELLQLKSPAIAWVNKNHFVVVERPVGPMVLVVDPPQFPRLYGREEFQKIWTGELLIISRPRIQGARGGSSPSIMFDELMYDCGTVETDGATTHSFSFYNAGGKLLRIKGVQADCGCVASLLPKQELEPGERSAIRVVFNAGGRSGKQRHKIAVSSNDPKRPKIELALTAFVRAEIEVKPPRVSFGEVVVGEGATKCVYVVDPGGEAFDIKSADADPSKIKVGVEPYAHGDDGTRRWIVRACLLPQAEPGDFAGKIVLTTSSLSNPVIEIPAAAVVVPDLAFVPSNAFFGAVRTGDKVEREITLYSRKGREFEIKGYSANGLPIQAHINTGHQSKRHQLVLELSAPRTTGLLKGSVDIHVQSASTETLRLLVTALVQEQK